MDNVVFKLRHKPSGLFATSADSKYTSRSSTKLSEDGKVYIRAPKKPDYMFEVIYPKHFNKKGHQTKPDDWELVAYELKEIKEISGDNRQEFFRP